MKANSTRVSPKVWIAGLVLVLAQFQAHATNVDFLWSNVHGFVSTENCQSVNGSGGDTGFEAYGDRVVEVTDAVDVAQAGPFEVVGSFWQESNEPSSWLKCADGGNENYYRIFDVFQSGDGARVAQVGLRPDELNIFKFVRLHSPLEAEQAMKRLENRTLAKSLISGVNAVEGSLKHVACASGGVTVMDTQLNATSVKVANGIELKPVQGFSGTELKTNAAGAEFVKVQLPDLSTGWVMKSQVQLQAQCPGEAPINALAAVQPKVSGWAFPTIQRTVASYKTGMRAFGAARAAGRIHAACDLYRIKGEQALAANSGTVIRDRYYFYEGTYALEVHHADGKVVRYGEILGKAAPGIAAGRAVQVGQTVGYIGKVNSNCCTPMLHFEMYSGKVSGPLTQKGDKFERRKDLLDPSSYLTDWEKAKFGTSY